MRLADSSSTLIQADLLPHLASSFCLHDPSTPAQNLSPFHISPSFSDSSASLHLFLAPAASTLEPSSDRLLATIYAFSNKGSYLFAQLSISSSYDPPASSPSIKVVSIAEHDIGIKTVFSAFDEARSRIAIWERATWKIRIFDLASSTSSPPLQPSTIVIEPSSDGSTAPTSLLFLCDRSLLLVGNAKGQLSLYSLSACESRSTLLTSGDAHSDGIQDLRILRRRKVLNEETERFGIESVGRDGMRKTVDITNEEGRCEVNVVDERWVAKGPVEKVSQHSLCFLH